MSLLAAKPAALSVSCNPAWPQLEYSCSKQEPATLAPSQPTREATPLQVTPAAAVIPHPRILMAEPQPTQQSPCPGSRPAPQVGPAAVGGPSTLHGGQHKMGPLERPVRCLAQLRRVQPTGQATPLQVTPAAAVGAAGALQDLVHLLVQLPVAGGLPGGSGGLIPARLNAVQLLHLLQQALLLQLSQETWGIILQGRQSGLVVTAGLWQES